MSDEDDYLHRSSFEVVSSDETAWLEGDVEGAVAPESARGLVRPPRRPARAIGPLFQCYQALLNLHDRTEEEEVAKDAVWEQLVQVREAEDPQ